ncbi:MAG: UvrB/UvrC motif-containing protein [Desulfosalsimonadaceae bacterium]
MLGATLVADEEERSIGKEITVMTRAGRRKAIEKLRREMQQASRELAFERAAELRDMVFELEKQL